MKHFNRRRDDPILPEELRAVDRAVREAARTVVPRQAFLDNLDAQVRRDATAHIAALPTPHADQTAITSPPLATGDDAIRADDTAVSVGWHPAIGIPVSRPARGLGRRGFLVGSAAAAVSGGFFALQRRNAIVTGVAATQQAGRAFVTAQMVAAAPPGTPTAYPVAGPSNLDFADGTVGWGLWGSNPGDYTIGIDPGAARGGLAGAYLRSNGPDPQGFGTLARTFTPDPYRGARLRMRATVKADAIENWAGLWMRVDGPGNQSLGFDNMQGRPITGTRDWRTYEIVLDIPPESTLLAFGILLAGKGGVWLSDVTFDRVGPDVPTTDALALPSRMQNLDFEAGTTGWFLAGDTPQDYRIAVDPTAPHGGSASASLQSTGDPLGGFGTLMQSAKADPYRGTRVRMAGWARASGVADWAGLWMRVDGPDTRKTQRSLSFDNMQGRPIKGTSDWTRYEIVLDVPPESVEIAFGILLAGTGEVWLDDVQFAAVGMDVPVTGTPTTG